MFDEADRMFDMGFGELARVSTPFTVYISVISNGGPILQYGHLAGTWQVIRYIAKFTISDPVIMSFDCM